MDLRTSLIKLYNWLQQFRWFCVLDIIVIQLLSVIKNPSYVFFALIALTLGTMGVWIGAFPQFLNGFEGFEENVSRISVFTFCIATLGNFATESYFNANKSDHTILELKRSLGIFAWSICLLLTFYSYLGCDKPLLGFWSTIIFWFMVNVENPSFRKVNNNAMDNMATKEGAAEEIGGAGL